MKLKINNHKEQPIQDEHIRTILKTDSEDENTVDNKLELLKYTSQVQSRIKTDISSDFTLAKFNEKDKEFIIEHTVTAYFTKKMLQIQKSKLVWDWINNSNEAEKGYWQQRKLTKAEKDYIDQIAKNAFDGFMNRIYMIAITNRNVDANHLLKYLSGIGDDGQPIIDPEELKISTKLKKLVEPKTEEQQ